MERSVHNGGRERAQSHWPCKSQNFREIAEFFRVVEKIADAVAWDKWSTADAKRLASGPQTSDNKEVPELIN